jgi:hypothetical protein
MFLPGSLNGTLMARANGDQFRENMEAFQGSNMENMEWPGKWHHFTIKQMQYLLGMFWAVV